MLQTHPWLKHLACILTQSDSLYQPSSVNVINVRRNHLLAASAQPHAVHHINSHPRLPGRKSSLSSELNRVRVKQKINMRSVCLELDEAHFHSKSRSGVKCRHQEQDVRRPLATGAQGADGEWSEEVSQGLGSTAHEENVDECEC